MVLAATHQPLSAHPVNHEAVAALWQEVKGLSLTDALAAFGFHHIPASFGARAILRGDTKVFQGTAGDTWTWLRRFVKAASKMRHPISTLGTLPAATPAQQLRSTSDGLLMLAGYDAAQITALRKAVRS
jgi:hypothetical protein